MYSSLLYNTAIQEYGIVSPTHFVQQVGKGVSLICYSASQVKWTKDGLDVYPRLMVHNNELFLLNVKEEHSGIYVCHGTTARGRRFEARSEILVGGKYIDLYN